jgi:uncharacterized protein (TIRG00374 family)
MTPPNGTSAAPFHRQLLKRHGGKLVASVVITLSLVFALQRGGLKVVPTGLDFSHVKWWTAVVYAALFFLMHYVRAVRWRFLLRRVARLGRKRVLVVSWVGFAAIMFLPFRLGELVRPYMIRKSSSVSLTAAAGSVVGERVVDGFFLSAVLAIALLCVPTLDPLPRSVVGIPIAVDKVRASGFVMLGVFTVALTVIAIFYFARAWAHRATLLVFGLVSRKLGERLAGFAERLADGLHFMGHGGDSVGFLLETSVYWGINLVTMWLLAWGCGVVHADGSAITIGETSALMGMLGCAVLIPGPPGLLGSFQAGIYAAMTMYFPTDVVVGPGAVYVFLLYALQVFGHVTAAAACLVFDRSALADVKAAEALVATSGASDPDPARGS